MRVFFTSPYAGKAKYQPFIDAIIAVLRRNHATIISPEDSPRYKSALQKLTLEGLNTERAHYAYVAQGIAEADVVIMEASYEDFRVGHEATLALLYNKPTLILSQQIDYSQYIPHELLFGKQYTTNDELRHEVQAFLDKADDYLSKASTTSQAIGGAADALHLAALSSSRQGALHDTSAFGTWARLAEKDPGKAYKEIIEKLGTLPVQEPWAVFAPVYNEYTPDYIFTGVANFAHSLYSKHKLHPTDLVVDVAAGTGALSRNLVNLGHRNLLAFDASREMLASAFHLCAHLPSIKIVEANIATLELPQPAKGMAWVDFSTNFALNEAVLSQWLTNLLNNLASGGVLLFDVRTVTGWQVSFFHQKVTTFATNNFQRIWVNLPDYEKHIITFDIFIRTRKADGSWHDWQREQMIEKMWTADEVRKVVEGLAECTVEGIFDDNFLPATTHDEPGLVYFVLKRT